MKPRPKKNYEDRQPKIRFKGKPGHKNKEDWDVTELKKRLKELEE
jgi:hypothetical protein